MADYYQKGDPVLSPIGAYYSDKAVRGYPVEDSRPVAATPVPPPHAYQPPTNSYQPAHVGVVNDNAGDNNVRVGQWDADLCGCCTHAVPNCLMPTFCPCVSIAQIAHRVNVLSYAVTLSIFAVVYLVLWALNSTVSYRFIYAARGPDLYCGYYYDYDSYYGYYSYYDCYYRHHSFGTMYGIFSALTFLAELGVFLFVWHLRAQIRARFQLPGSGCGDCLASLFCTCCSIAQLATHVKSYKPNNCDFAPPDTLPAYTDAASNYA